MTKTERKLLLDLGDALDHWLHQYAPEQCDPKHVAVTHRVMMEEGGTLAYVARLRQRIREKVKP